MAERSKALVSRIHPSQHREHTSLARGASSNLALVSQNDSFFGIFYTLLLICFI